MAGWIQTFPPCPPPTSHHLHHSQVPKVRAFVERHGRSVLLEVQSRSCEFSKMFKFERMRPQVRLSAQFAEQLLHLGCRAAVVQDMSV